ncbi:MAG: proline dehydrogenase family protein [Nitrospiraceae bacterium]
MSIDPLSLEPLIHQIGTAMAQGMAGAAPTVFDRKRWSQGLLDWAMHDPEFKVQLFRFVDVLPVLRHDEQVVRLVDEYFSDQERLGRLFQWGMKFMAGSTVAAKLGARSLRKQVEQMAGTFIAGATVSQAAPILTQLWKDGRACSVDLLGEATVSEVEADRYRDRCLSALRELAQTAVGWPAAPLLERGHVGGIPRAQLSIKISALYSQLDPIDPEGSYAAVADRLRPLLDLAQSISAGVIFDMEQAELKDLTLFIFMRLLSEPAYRAFPHAGLALQAYHKNTVQDVADLIAWCRKRGTPITVRLVKGAYWDSDWIRYTQRGWPIPLFTQKSETDVAYESLTRMLLDHHQVIRPAFGTHNLRTLAHAEAYASRLNLPAHAWEYQMIYGMAEPLQAAVTQRGRRLRLYTPVGELLPGMAYLVRRLLENTSNESFLRKEYVESQPLDVLLAKPDLPVHLSKETREPAAEAVAFRNEPHSDFSLAPVRASMAAAIQSVRRSLGGPVSIPWVSDGPSLGPPLVVRNPSRPDEILGTVPTVLPSDLSAVMEEAKRRLPPWSGTPVSERASIMRRAASLMKQRRYELAAWEVLEEGKPWREADADVAEAIDFLLFYAHRMEQLGAPRRLGHEPGELNHQSYQSRGIAAVIAPWNFPLAIPTGMVSAALVTGNVVLFKPSERAPMVGCLLGRILAEAGLPAGVLQVLPGGPALGRVLVEHPDVGVIAFTGSKDAGLWILGQAVQVRKGQRHVKRVIAEMGGKNAIIVDETADLDEAVSGVVASFTGYQGQKCSACSRVIVHEAVHDLFVQRLTEAVLAVTIGPPEDPGSRMGPMIDERALKTVRDYVEIGRHEGRLIIDRAMPGPGYFQGPVLIAEIRPEHRLAQEEIFGPVLAVMRAPDFSQALGMANATDYALTGGVYSRSPKNLQIARERFDVGNLYINRPITGALVGRQPFGGHRLSGVGTKAGGDDYLLQFMTARVVSENTLRRGFAPIE